MITLSDPDFYLAVGDLLAALVSGERTLLCVVGRDGSQIECKRVTEMTLLELPEHKARAACLN